MLDLATLLLVLLAVVGSTGLFGVLGYLIVRVRRLAGRANGAGSAELLGELRQVQEELARTQGHVAELSEKVDFAERLLAGGPADTSGMSDDDRPRR